MIVHDYQPNAMQRLLLTALLAPAPAAREAAQRWLDAIVWDDLELGDMRLMPMLSERLIALGLDHPLAGRIRGLYRRAWYLDRTMRHELAQGMARIARSTATPVLLKGPALGLYAYARPTMRPFADFDVLVPFADFDKVVADLLAQGAQAKPYDLHSLTLTLGGPTAFDIHRSPYAAAFRPHHVAPLFTRLRSIPIDPDMPQGATWLTLGDADQLLHTFAHGLRPNPVSPLRWLVDAVELLRVSRESIDWDLFLAEAERLAYVEPALLGLSEARGFVDTPGIDAAIARLETMTTPRRLRGYAHEVADRGPVAVWARTRRNARGLRRIAMMARFYRGNWQGNVAANVLRKIGPACLDTVKAIRTRLTGAG